MSQTPKSFVSENLEVDYLRFTIRGLSITESHRIAKIIDYLSNSFHLNCSLRTSRKDEYESMISKPENRYRVYLEPSNNAYWFGTCISFSGENAAYFYQLVKERKVDWNSFCDASNFLDCLNLHRFDLYYFRSSNEPTNEQKLNSFLAKCVEKRLKSKNRVAWSGRKEQGLIAKIGHRRSDNHYRIYEKPKGVKFELEMRNKLIRSFQNDFFSNNFEALEDQIACHYFQQSKKCLCYNNYESCYADWLILSIRKNRLLNKNLGLLSDYRTLNERISSLITLYCKANQTIDSDFLTLLQFLSFCHYQVPEKQLTEDPNHYRMEFPILDFMTFSGRNINYYQFNQTLQFFDKLLDLNLWIRDISNDRYIRFAAFPYLEFCNKGLKQIVILKVAKELIFYRYPYWFPASFLTPNDHYDQKVICQLIESFSNVGFQKVFPVQEFFEKVKNSNYVRTKLRNYIIERLQELIEAKIIRSKFWIVYQNGSEKFVSNLTPRLLKELDLFIFEEILE